MPRISTSRQVLIPFIAGQWSLPAARAGGSAARLAVLIPFIAGQWSLPLLRRWGRRDGTPVLIPFIAGQWSLPGALIDSLHDVDAS